MKKSNVISDLENRIKELEGKKDDKGKEDDTVCPECGSDLLVVEEGIVYCEKCKVYYEQEE